MVHCRACLIATSEAQLATLDTMALRTGFATPCIGLPAWRADGASDRMLPFFFFHARMDAHAMASFLAEIRSHQMGNVRFCPTIAVVGTCSEDDIARLISMGFDDIVMLPEAPGVLRRRFASQLDRDITYFETQTYFGPDRRRFRHTQGGQHRRGTEPSEHTRYIVRRTPQEGVTILRREVILSGGRAPLTTLAPAMTLRP